jgi:tRNA(Ile)-lysidine synthetase-like protein
MLSGRFKGVTVRNRRPGDRLFSRAGSRGKTLKKLFLERKVPISARDRLIIVEAQGNILWIEGFPVIPKFIPGETEAEGFEIDVISETFQGNPPSK